MASNARPQAVDASTPVDPLAPLWYRTAPPLREHPRIRIATRELAADAADVVVIGAGVTGLSAALHLAAQGVRVTVLERYEPGYGSTGRANGQIIAGLQMTPGVLLDAYGAEQGERMIAFAGSAPDLVFDLIARHGIECDAERHGWVQATRRPQQLDDMQQVVDAWASRGAPVRMLDRNEIAGMLGTDEYAGGWVDARNGTIQPLAYARGLAIAAARAGASVLCGIDVVEVERAASQQWRIRTDAGDLHAPHVVLATNASTSALRGIARQCVGRSVLSAHSVQIATAPLDAAQLRTILPQRHSCGDTEHLRLRYFRLDHDGRFVIGGPGWVRPPRSASALSFRILERALRRMFPQLAELPLEHHWFARDTLTADLVPHLYEPSPGMFAALGYNGRGLAIGTALGTLLARRVLGEPAAGLPYPTTDASPVPFNVPATAKFYAQLGLQRLRRWVR